VKPCRQTRSPFFEAGIVAAAAITPLLSASHHAARKDRVQETKRISRSNKPFRGAMARMKGIFAGQKILPNLLAPRQSGP